MLSEVRLNIHETAVLLGNVDERTVRRWVAGGLPRRRDGLFEFPLTALWWMLRRHHHDPRCRRHVEEDLLLVLRHAFHVMPEPANTVATVQRLLRQLSGFELSSETLERLAQR